jgi:hypothetical protein
MAGRDQRQISASAVAAVCIVGRRQSKRDCVAAELWSRWSQTSGTFKSHSWFPGTRFDRRVICVSGTFTPSNCQYFCHAPNGQGPGYFAPLRAQNSGEPKRRKLNGPEPEFAMLTVRNRAEQPAIPSTGLPPLDRSVRHWRLNHTCKNRSGQEASKFARFS